MPEIERIARRRPKTAYTWRRASQFRRAGSLPPDVQLRIWEHVQLHRLPIRPEWLIQGAPRAEIEAALAARDAAKVAAE